MGIFWGTVHLADNIPNISHMKIFLPGLNWLYCSAWLEYGCVARTDVSLSAFAFLFAEVVAYCSRKAGHMQFIHAASSANDFCY